MVSYLHDSFCYLRQPADEKYFSVPLHNVRRKLLGLRDSGVASSAWRRAFKHPLETRPYLDLFKLEYAIPGCGACKLGGREAIVYARVRGARYDQSTFEVRILISNPIRVLSVAL